MKYTVDRKNPLNLSFTLDSGQAFRWERDGDIWVGVVRQKVCKVKQEGRVLVFTGFALDEFIDYFGLNQSMEEIIEESFRAEEVVHLPKIYEGLRILNQEPYECLFSFLLATRTSIERIKKMIEQICINYGERIVSDGKAYFTFPSPEKFLEGAEKLKVCGLGFRENRVLDLAEMILSGNLNLEKITAMNYEKARESLLKINGVGQKVADCVCLFSLRHYSSFPIDVHISSWFRGQNYRELEEVIGALSKGKMTERVYRTLAGFARKRFGRFAGYVQQYIFFDELCQNARGKRAKSTMQPAATNAM